MAGWRRLLDGGEGGIIPDYGTRGILEIELYHNEFKVGELAGRKWASARFEFLISGGHHRALRPGGKFIFWKGIELMSSPLSTLPPVRPLPPPSLFTEKWKMKFGIPVDSSHDDSIPPAGSAGKTFNVPSSRL